jgi:hypothetical protein
MMMRRTALSQISITQLRERFADIASAQGDALLENDTRTFNRLFDQMSAIELELKSRAGDQRSELLSLLDHSNLAVRWKAALATRAIAPQAARQALESVANSGQMPIAGHAGMNLRNFDSGFSSPP